MPKKKVKTNGTSEGGEGSETPDNRPRDQVEEGVSPTGDITDNQVKIVITKNGKNATKNLIIIHRKNKR